MNNPLDFKLASRNLQVTPTLEQEIIILDNRALSNQQVSELSGIPVAAISVIRNRLFLTSTTTRKLARVENAHAAFILVLDGLNADAISEKLGVGRNIVIALVREFLARAKWFRANSKGEPWSGLDWKSLRDDAQAWREFAPAALDHALQRRNDIACALSDRLEQLNNPSD